MPDLCSADDVRAYLGLSLAASSVDDLLPRLVSASSAWLIGQIGQPIASTAVTDVLSGDGGFSQRLRFSPVRSIQSVVIDGNTIPPCTDTTDGWSQQDDWLWLSGPKNAAGALPWGPMGPYMSPTRMTTLRFTVGNGNVVVGYTAGFDPVPEDIRQGVVELAAEAYQRRQRLGVMSKSIAGESITFQTLTLTASLKGLIAAYSTTRI
jgi:hypothetical protein